MTSKEIAEVAGVHRSTVIRKIKEIFPEKIKNGKVTKLEQDEAIRVVSDLRKSGFVQPMQNAQVPTQNAEVEKRLDRLEAILEKALTIMTALLQNTPRSKKIALPMLVDKMTVDDFLTTKNVKIYNSRELWRQMAIASRELTESYCREVRHEYKATYTKTFYDVDILEMAFEKVKKSMR